MARPPHRGLARPMCHHLVPVRSPTPAAALVVVLSPECSPDQFVFAVQQSRPGAVFVDSVNLAETARTALGEADSDANIVFAGARPKKGGWPKNTKLWDGFVAVGAESVSADHIDSLRRAAKPKDVCQVTYVAWDDGLVRGLEFTHAALLWQATTACNLLQLTQRDALVLLYQLAAVEEQVMCCYVPMCSGCSVTVAPYWQFGKRGFQWPAFPAVLRTVRPTVFVTTPRLWEKLARPATTDELYVDLLAEAHCKKKGQERSRRSWVPTAVLRWLPSVGSGSSDTFLLRRGLCRTRFAAVINGALRDETRRLFACHGLEVNAVAGFPEVCGAYAWGGEAGLEPLHSDIDVREDGEGGVMVRGPNAFSGYHGSPAGLDPAGDGFVRDLRRRRMLVTAHGDYVSSLFVRSRLLELDIVRDAFVWAEGRAHACALLQLEHDFVPKLLEMTAEEAEDACEQHAALYLAREVRQRLRADVQGLNAALPKSHRVHKFGIHGGHLCCDPELTESHRSGCTTCASWQNFVYTAPSTF
eukprot:TRINITY_DN5697_c0_g1_i3.p1 TRINITY_DN5697_c0_g1~~TRINITY_DN5697_c0_g1_i3.p1  ORF type:complete len:528 (-),score=121.85 TRINITY_DN5697_c0_g1_i3:161-1744(-)